MKHFPPSLLAIALCLSSCAYLQTHKNIQEAFHEYEGYRLVEPLKLYSAGGAWYLAVQRETMELHYPVLHDSIFLENDYEPRYSTTKVHEGVQYHRISGGTAQVLLRNDGYYTLPSLFEEMNSMNTEPVSSLPAGARQHTILARVDAHTSHSVAKTTKRIPESTPVLANALAGLDFVCVDFPCSVAYNVAIPVMAPFVFFHDFIAGDDDNDNNSN